MVNDTPDNQLGTINDTDPANIVGIQVGPQEYLYLAHLRQGLKQVEAGDFSTRIEVEAQDEFGQVAGGYFATVGEAAGIPVIAYNLPGVTGMNLDRDFYGDLFARTDTVKYIKDTSGSLEQALDLIFNLGDSIDTFVGWDTIVLPAFASGAAGSIWGAPNFAPKECVAIYELAQKGQYHAALEIFKRLWNVLDFLGKEGYAVATKAAAEAAGVQLGAPRAPYSPLAPEKADQLRKLVAESGLNYH